LRKIKIIFEQAILKPSQTSLLNPVKIFLGEELLLFQVVSFPDRTRKIDEKEIDEEES